MTIPDDYAYEDFMADCKTAAPFILALDSKGEHAEEMVMLLAENEQITDAFGRLTAYAERNGITEMY